MSDSEQFANEGGEVSLEEIRELIPHRYPFLLIDRVLHWKFGEEKTLTAIKNVTINEPFFQGHFPDNAVMPGVLIVEAMAQACGVLGGLSMRGQEAVENLYYLVKVDKARFSKTVVPGDQLVLEVEETRRMRKMGIFSCRALVDGKKVAQAELMCAGKA